MKVPEVCLKMQKTLRTTDPVHYHLQNTGSSSYKMQMQVFVTDFTL